MQDTPLGRTTRCAADLPDVKQLRLYSPTGADVGRPWLQPPSATQLIRPNRCTHYFVAENNYFRHTLRTPKAVGAHDLKIPHSYCVAELENPDLAPSVNSVTENSVWFNL